MQRDHTSPLALDIHTSLNYNSFNDNYLALPRRIYNYLSSCKVNTVDMKNIEVLKKHLGKMDVCKIIAFNNQPLTDPNKHISFAWKYLTDHEEDGHRDLHHYSHQHAAALTEDFLKTFFFERQKDQNNKDNVESNTPSWEVITNADCTLFILNEEFYMDLHNKEKLLNFTRDYLKPGYLMASMNNVNKNNVYYEYVKLLKLFA